MSQDLMDKNRLNSDFQSVPLQKPTSSTWNTTEVQNAQSYSSSGSDYAGLPVSKTRVSAIVANISTSSLWVQNLMWKSVLIIEILCAACSFGSWMMFSHGFTKMPNFISAGFAIAGFAVELIARRLDSKLKKLEVATNLLRHDPQLEGAATLSPSRAREDLDRFREIFHLPENVAQDVMTAIQQRDASRLHRHLPRLAYEFIRRALLDQLRTFLFAPPLISLGLCLLFSLLKMNKTFSHEPIRATVFTSGAVICGIIGFVGLAISFGLFRTFRGTVVAMLDKAFASFFEEDAGAVSELKKRAISADMLEPSASEVEGTKQGLVAKGIEKFNSLGDSAKAKLSDAAVKANDVAERTGIKAKATEIAERTGVKDKVTELAERSGLKESVSASEDRAPHDIAGQDFQATGFDTEVLPSGDKENLRYRGERSAFTDKTGLRQDDTLFNRDAVRTRSMDSRQA